MPFKTATDVVVACENTLGWSPAAGTPLWQARRTEAAKLLRAMAADPARVTFRNLELTVAWLRLRKTPVASPVGLIYHIDKALERANEQVVTTDLKAEIDRAKAVEFGRSDEELGHWITRLTRAQGAGRADELADWKAAGRDA